MTPSTRRDEAVSQRELQGLADRLERVDFPVSFRGYDPRAVRDFVQSIADELRLLTARGAGSPVDVGAVARQTIDLRDDKIAWPPNVAISSRHEAPWE